MENSIIERIRALEGDFLPTDEQSLQSQLTAIVLKTPLYPKPTDTPWASAAESEPIIGISQYLTENQTLLEANQAKFFHQLLVHYFGPDHGARYHGQSYFQTELFTPFREGTADYQRWQGLIAVDDVHSVVRSTPLDFMKIAWSYGYPDAYYVCLSDPNPQNPIVYGTDHEEFFKEIEPNGTLLDFLNSFFTKAELLATFDRFTTQIGERS
ncbi:MAG: hypothetical protein ACTHZ1_07975 [Sphingobacterium sp.]